MSPPGDAKLMSGSVVRLHDTTLSQINHGFERPWLFGKLGDAGWREPGYHIFPLYPSLYTITKSPYPVDIDIAYVAVPDNFVVEEQYLLQTHQKSLGQRNVPGTTKFFPPLRPWEAYREWAHPAYREIHEWYEGVSPSFEWKWSCDHNRK
jgi:hypothetical protein